MTNPTVKSNKAFQEMLEIEKRIYAKCKLEWAPPPETNKKKEPAQVHAYAFKKLTLIKGMY